jgi:hypothetical protein
MPSRVRAREIIEEFSLETLQRFACLASLGAALRMLEHFRSQSQPKVPRRTIEQPDAELVLELRNPPAHGRKRHAESARAASEKLLASTTFANTTSALRSVTAPVTAFQIWKFEQPVGGGQGRSAPSL